MANTLFIGKVYHRFDELPSTNDYARDLLAKSKPAEGTVIRAAMQSAGRGQIGSYWWSEAGANLTLSCILYPRWLPATAAFRLSEAVALAVHDTVCASLLSLPILVPEIRLKWPNDVYIDSRKTAGILIQNTLGGNFLQSSVVGIGLNVNQTVFPPEAPNATSLALAAGHPLGLERVADTLFECLEKRYLQLKSGDPQNLRMEYEALLLGKDEYRWYARPDGKPFLGMILGVGEDGRLIVRNDTGVEVFALKEIQMLSNI